MTHRRQLLQSTMYGALAGLVPAWAHAQQGASARILLGVPPGGGADRVTRAVAEKLQGVYAPAVIVENRPGAGGQIAVTAARDANADGSTLLMTISSALAIFPYSYPKLPYKTDDVTPVSLVCYANHGLALGPAVPESVKTMKDFLAWCKANPAQANYGSPAAGSIAHLVVAAIADSTKTELRHVPYKGTGPGLTDLLGGQIGAMSAPAGSFLPHLQSGKLRLIGITGDKRSSYAPQVPTFREQGFDITAREWYGMFLPKAAKPETVARLNAALKTALANPELVASLAAMGMEIAYSTPEQLTDILKADGQEWKGVIQRLGFTAES